jgi:F0F1-type ATP synthase assembly protein I
MQRDPNTRFRYVRLVGTLGSVPLMLGAGPLVGYFFGRWLDRRLGTWPWLQFVFLALGFAAAVRYIVRLLRMVQKDIDKM